MKTAVVCFGLLVLLASAVAVEPMDLLDDTVTDDVELTPASAVAEQSEDSDETPLPPQDLLDVSVDELTPDLESPKFKAMRTRLSELRADLMPIHQKICGDGSNWAGCIARRDQNAQIIQDVLDGKKTAAKKAKRSPCQKGAQRCAAYKYLRRQHHALVHVYNRLYRRYVMTLAKFYKKRFRTLARAFVRTIKRLRYEAYKTKKENQKLRDDLSRLRKDHAVKMAKNAREHRALSNRFNNLKRKHASHLKMSKKRHAQAMAALAREKKMVAKLKGIIAALRKKLAQTEAERKKHAKNGEAARKLNAKLRGHGAGLAKQLAGVQKQLKDRQARVRQLEALVKRLTEQIATLKRLLAASRGKAAAAEKARQNLQAAYNNLVNRYNNAVKAHGKRANAQSALIRTLRSQVKNLANRCIPDACGQCGGDESSCANTRSRRQCYAVGDPHYRTFDGVTFDFQYDGQFVLSKHQQWFEVQNLQRRARHCCPRINKGLAVRCGHEVVVAYTDWTFDRLLVNGAQKKLPNKRWIRVGPGFTVYKAHGMWFRWRCVNRFKQVAVVTSAIARWGGGNHQNVYINAPWQWSSGRSMWGTCGDYDSYSGNDRWWINRWWKRKFTVTNSKRDMFRNPGRRTEEAEEDIEAFDQDEIETMMNEDAKDGVVHESEIAELEDTKKTPSTQVDNRGDSKPKKASIASALKRVPEKNRAALKATAVKACADVETKNTRLACIVEVILGVAPEKARRRFMRFAGQGNSKELTRCFHINSKAFALVPPKKFPKPAKGGFAFSFWFKPTAIDNKPTVIFSKGENFVLAHGADLEVKFGETTASVKNCLSKGKFTQFITEVNKDGGLNVFVNGKRTATAKSKGKAPEASKSELALGGSDNTKSANGWCAHLYYIPVQVDDDMAKDHAKVSPEKCGD